MSDAYFDFVKEETAAYLASFRRESEGLIKEMEDFAAANSIPIILPQGAEFLETAVAAAKPKKILELGMAIGYSALRMALAYPETHIVTIEKSPGSMELAAEFISRSEAANHIEICFGEAEDILPSLQNGFDMVFLDADKKDYLRLLELALPLLKQGGLFIADNLLWHGYAAAKDEDVPESYRQSTEYIREFNRVFFSHPKLKSILLPLGDGIGFAVKTSAA